MKILVICDVPLVGFRPGMLVRSLGERGHEITFLGPRLPAKMSLENRGYEKVKAVYIYGGHRWGDLHERGRQFVELSFKLNRLLKSEKFDLLRPMMLLADYLTIKCNQKYKSPILAGLTDIYSDIYRQVNLPLPGLAVPLITHMERVIMKNSDLLVVDTPVMRDLWKKWGLDEKKSVVLPFGEDYEMFRKGDCQKVKKKYELTNEKIVLFHGGDITHLDGLDILIEATELLVKTIQEPFKVMIIGEGLENYMNFLKQLIKNKKLDKYFIFTGYIARYEDVPGYLACADVCVNPCSVNLTSYYNVPHKVIEYILMNKPTVCTDVPGVKSMFSDAIYYIPPKSPKALYKAITQILNDDTLREKLIARTKEIAEYYRAEKIIAHEEKLMYLLVSKKVDDFRQFDWQLTYYK